MEQINFNTCIVNYLICSIFHKEVFFKKLGIIVLCMVYLEKSFVNVNKNVTFLLIMDLLLTITQPWSIGALYDGTSSPRICLFNRTLKIYGLYVLGNRRRQGIAFLGRTHYK